LEVECCKKSNYSFDLIFEKVAVRIFGTCYWWLVKSLNNTKNIERRRF